MKQLKIGFLPLYIKLYDDFTGPPARADMEAYMARCIENLRGRGIEVVEADQVCRIKPEFDAAAAKFNAADVDAVVTLHLAYSPSLESIEALASLKAPIVVFDSTVHYEFSSVAGEMHRVGPNHGIHGVQDMCNLLKRRGIPYTLCVGHADHSPVLDEVEGACRAAAAAHAYRTARVGSVGGSFTGMGDFLISDERYKAEIGAEVFYMTSDVVEKYLARITDAEIDAEMAADAARFTIEVEAPENYRAATKAGLAVRKWMADQQLTAATVNFLTLDQCGLPKMPFPECCKILERGLGYGGEGDALTAGLVGALASVYPETTFTEMFCPDWETDKIFLSHMGESNPRLAKWKPLITDKPFKFNSCGDTVALYTCARAGRATIVNLAPMEDSFTLILCPGELLDDPNENSMYRKTTRGWFKPPMPIREFLKKYSENGGTHHSAMVYGVPTEELVAFGKMMGFDVAVIE